MATATSYAHYYAGQAIYPCERIAGEHAGRWIIQAYHYPTGMAYSDELCPHFATLKAAYAHIRETRFEALRA